MPTTVPLPHPAALTTTVLPAHGQSDVSVLRWPDEEPLRRLLASFQLPRLLLVAQGHAPPGVIDDLEDWMRAPAEDLDLVARAHVLRHRARAVKRPSPALDSDGLLRVGADWVALTPAQIPVVRVLLEQLGRVVHSERIADAYRSGGGSTHPGSLRTVLRRIGLRVAPLGLELVLVRRRGVLLTIHPQSDWRRPQG